MIKRAMLLCAGYGTRLAPLTDHLPKPLLPVCNVPILRYSLANFAAHGIQEVVINRHHLPHTFAQAISDGDFGLKIHFIDEPEILGTGGGLKNALSLLDPDGADEPFLSSNGKLIFDLDITALAQAYAADTDCLGMVVVREVPDAADWGALEVRPEGNGHRLHNVFGPGQHMFCGVHVTKPSVVSRLPDGESCMIRQGYLPWIKQGQRVRAFVSDPSAYFAEHSTPQRYLAGSIDLLAGARLSNPPAALVGIDRTAQVSDQATIVPPVTIGPGAQIAASVTVGPSAVIGANAVIEANVKNAVVWPGARVDEDTSEKIVHGRD